MNLVRQSLAGCLAMTALLATLSLASAQTLSDARTWTDATGEHRVKAALVEITDDDHIVLRTEDGRTIRVPMTRLSKADQAFARRAVVRRTRSAADQAAKTQVAAAAPDSAKRFEWPQWRGPDRTGISNETNLLQSWPEGGPPLEWRVEGLGSGYSSVAVTGGKIFTMGKVQGETKLIALDETDGSQLWSTPLGGGDDPNCTPTVDGDLVFALSHAGDLLCAEAETGRTLWKKNFSDDFGGRMMSGWGYSESPLVDGDRLICTPGSQDAMLAALDKRTGEVIWKTPMPADAGSRGQDGAAYSSIVVGNCGGVRQYIQLVGRGLISVDAKTGKLLWGYNRIANGTANIPTPLVDGNYVFCSSGYGTGSALLEVDRGASGWTPREVYFKNGNELQNHHGGMILLNRHVFLGNGHNNGFPVCIELRSGRDAWRPGRGPGGGSAAVTYADGHLYFRYEDGVMALIEADPSSYKLKGKFQIASNNGRSWPHPVIANGRLYLRDQHELLCYDVRAQQR